MLTTILTYIIIIFAIFGLTFCIENLWLFLIKPKGAPQRTIIIYLKKDIARMQIVEILEERLWRGESKIGKVIAVNYDIDYDEFLNLKNEFENKDFIFLEKSEINNWTP